jgi:mono/diheme cytochrome c family protein
MAMRERVIWIALVLGLLIALRSGGGAAREVVATSRPRAQPGVRLSMDALHQQGGVPLGWQLTLAPGDVAAGRRAFADFGCGSCHQVGGDTSATAATASALGPDLSGMGSHHPPAYFAEAILNPDAVLIDAPGYLGADGRSTMPVYPDMTLGQLSDLVAYLTSLTQGGSPSCHAPGTAMPVGLTTVTRIDLQNRPVPSPARATRFFIQSYDVLPGQLAAFEDWFSREGRAEFLAVDGLVSVDTFVDTTRPGGALSSVFGFRDEAALRNFMGDPASAALWQQFDAFLGPHGHMSTDRPLVYRAASLSTG